MLKWRQTGRQTDKRQRRGQRDRSRQRLKNNERNRNFFFNPHTIKKQTKENNKKEKNNFASKEDFWSLKNRQRVLRQPCEAHYPGTASPSSYGVGNNQAFQCCASCVLSAEVYRKSDFFEGGFNSGVGSVVCTEWGYGCGAVWERRTEGIHLYFLYVLLYSAEVDAKLKTMRCTCSTLRALLLEVHCSSIV